MKTPEYAQHMLQMQKLHAGILSSINLLLAKQSGSNQLMKVAQELNDAVVEECNDITAFLKSQSR